MSAAMLADFYLGMLTREQKQEILNELADKIKRQKSLIITDVTGVDVSEIQDLRRKLRQSEIEYRVAKKTLIDLALKKDPIRQKLSNGVKKLTGTIALAISYDDPIVPVKILDNFSKEHESFKILGGIMEDKVLSIEDVEELAKIPSKDELLAKLVSSIKGPISGLVNVLQAPLEVCLFILRFLGSPETSNGARQH